MMLLESLKRYFELNGFWARRTALYRDLARALKERELPKDFVTGELEIALAPKTSDYNRARGLRYMHDLMDIGDPSLHEVLVRTMPRADGMALTILRDAKDRPASLLSLAKTVEDQNALTKVVRQALVSPLILVPVGFAFAYMLSTLTIPAFAKAAPPEVWTGYNWLVRVAAEFLAAWGPALAAVVTAFFIWLFSWALPNWSSPLRFKLESVRGWKRVLVMLVCPIQPVFSMYRDIQGTRMLGNLANLLQSNMLLIDALIALGEGAQPWMRRHLQYIGAHLDHMPGDYVGAFSHGVLSTFLLSRLNSAVRRDAGGKFDAVLIDIGSVGQEEARESVKRSAVVINAVLLVLTLAVIMFFYIGQSSIASGIEEANSPTAVMKRTALRKQQINKSLNKPSPSTTTSP